MKHSGGSGIPGKTGYRCQITYFLIALCALWASTSAIADCDRRLAAHRIQVWQTEDGLPLDTVTALAQTPDGFLWVGTEDGLVRFDGISFQRAPVDDIMGNVTETFDVLAVDTDGNLSAGTSAAGIVTLPASGGAPVLSWASDHAVTDLLADAAGSLWVATLGQGLLRRHRGEASPKRLTGSENAAVGALAVRREGGVWVGLRGAGLKWFEAGDSWYPGSDERLRSLYIEALLERADGSLWIAAREGLYRLRDGQLQNLSEDLGIRADAHASTLLEDAAGALWIGTAGAGVIRACGERVERLGSDSGMPNDSILALFQDAEHSIWIGTGGGGLVQLALTAVTGITEREGLPAAPVLPIMQHSDGSMWIGTFGGGLTRWLDGVAEPVGGLSSDRVLSLAEGPDGDVWIGTRDGLNHHDPEHGIRQYGTDDGLPQGSLGALIHDGDTLWIGSISALYAFRDGRFDDVRPASGELDANVMHLFRDREGTLWVSTDGAGLYFLKDGVLQRPPFAEQMPSRVVFGTYEAPGGALWFHTSRGLLRWDGEQVGLVGSRHGLLDPQVASMIDDGRGGIWMSGNRGLFRAEASDLDAVALGSLDQLEVEQIGVADGMPSSETNGGFQPSAWRARDGRLWYPTMAGVAVVDPREFDLGLQAPDVLIDSIVVRGERLPASSPQEVAPRPDWIEFNYAAPTFLRPEHLLFEHRLLGFDEAWYATRERTALFRRPPAGRYTFEVRVRRTGGEWSEPAASEVYIQRHLLEQPALWLALLALSAALGLIAVRQSLRLRARRRDQMERAQRMEAVGLLAGGVAHDFNNILSIIMTGTDLLLSELPESSPLRARADKVMDAATRGAGLTRQLLTFARRQPVHPQWIDLGAEVAGMEPFLRSLLPGQTELVFDVEAGTAYCFIDPVQLQQVVLNLVVNSRDAMPEGGRLSLTLRREHSRTGGPLAVLTVTDSGVGIDPGLRQRIFEPLFTTKPQGTGLGLAVSHSIVQQARGQIQVESSPGSGAKFRVELPVVDKPPKDH